jgi:cardiolipin synthase A/B
VLVIAILVAVIVFLLIVIWSIRRHREPRLTIETDAPLETLLPTLAGHTHSGLSEGNAVELLENGAFFDVLLADMQAAQRSLHFETYLWGAGELCGRVVSVLAGRAKAGVQVRVLVDARGGKEMGEAAAQALIAAGCKLRYFHPQRLKRIGMVNERDHRKLVVIDGRTAFMGGHCIKDEWLGNAERKGRYRDLSVRVRGPIVHAAQSTFSENWVEETGELFVGEDYFPRQERVGDVTMHIARAKPSGAAPAVKILHHLVIAMARKRIWIQNPYFIPGPAAADAFASAVKRGVDVRIMVPDAQVSDMPFVQHAAHRNFGRLLASGVRIFEYQRTLLHQKVMIVDGVWCAIGSSNFDDRSLEINDEITVGCHSPELTKRFEDVFLADARHCVELERESWMRRGLFHRLKDNAYYLLKYQL